MIDKYREITIYEVENGWIFKTLPSENPNNVNQVAYISTYCKDIDSLIEKLKEVVN